MLALRSVATGATCYMLKDFKYYEQQLVSFSFFMCVKRSELMRSEQSELHLVKHTESPECERKTKVNLSKMDFKT